MHDNTSRRARREARAAAKGLTLAPGTFRSLPKPRSGVGMRNPSGSQFWNPAEALGRAIEDALDPTKTPSKARALTETERAALEARLNAKK